MGIVSTTLIVVSVITIFSIGVAHIDAHKSWQDIVAGSVSVDTKGQNLELSLEAADDIDQVSYSSAGFAWKKTDGSMKAAISLISASSEGPARWQPYTVSLTSVIDGDDAIPGVTDCLSSNELTRDPGSVSIRQGDKMVVTEPNGDPAEYDGTAISFDIVHDTLGTTCASGLGIGIHDTEPEEAAE